MRRPGKVVGTFALGTRRLYDFLVLLALEQASQAPGLRDELAAVIRVLHVRLGFDEGGLP